MQDGQDARDGAEGSWQARHKQVVPGQAVSGQTQQGQQTQDEGHEEWRNIVSTLPPFLQQ